LLYCFLSQPPHKANFIKSSFLSEVEDLIFEDQLQQLNDTINNSMINSNFPKISIKVRPLIPGEPLNLPLVQSKVPASFPSPATDYMEEPTDLNALLIPRPHSTFLVTVEGVSMNDARIYNGDILIVDKSLEPSNNQIIIAYVDDAFTVKRLSKIKGKLYLVPENENYKPILLTEHSNFKVWGVVTWGLHKF